MHYTPLIWKSRCPTSPVATGGASVGLALQTKLQAPPNWNVKHYKSVEFLSILQFLESRTNAKPHHRTAELPCWKLSGDGSVSDSDTEM